MAKAPVSGEVKTRLCPPLAPHEASQLYGCFLEDTIEKAQSMPSTETVVYYAPSEAEGLFRSLVGTAAKCIPQPGGDVGERMSECFSRLCSPGRQVVIIGTDCPTLPESFIEQSLKVLECGAADLVLGPCSDGGYCLIGMNSHNPRLFEGVSWSTPAVLDQTLSRAADLRLRVSMLPEWYDVDTKEDLPRLVADLLNQRESEAPLANRTTHYLKDLLFAHPDLCNHMP